MNHKKLKYFDGLDWIATIHTEQQSKKQEHFRFYPFINLRGDCFHKIIQSYNEDELRRVVMIKVEPACQVMKQVLEVGEWDLMFRIEEETGKLFPDIEEERERYYQKKVKNIRIRNSG